MKFYIMHKNEEFFKREFYKLSTQKSKKTVEKLRIWESYSCYPHKKKQF